VGLDLGDPRRNTRRINRCRSKQVAEVGQSVGDRVDDRGLKADGSRQGMDGMENPSDRGLAVRREGPLQVASLEFLRSGITRAVVLRDIEEAPTDEAVQRALQLSVVDRIVPAGGGEPRSDPVERERWAKDGGVLEHAHDRDVQLVEIRRREPKEISGEMPPRSADGHMPSLDRGRVRTPHDDGR
jgi:hypothetical protein